MRFKKENKNMSKFSYPIESEDHDNVNSPSHYQGKVECIDCIESATTGLNGIEDLKKAKWYIDKIISVNGE